MADRESADTKFCQKMSVSHEVVDQALDNTDTIERAKSKHSVDLIDASNSGSTPMESEGQDQQNSPDDECGQSASAEESSDVLSSHIDTSSCPADGEMVSEGPQSAMEPSVRNDEPSVEINNEEKILTGRLQRKPLESRFQDNCVCLMLVVFACLELTVYSFSQRMCPSTPKPRRTSRQGALCRCLPN